MKSETENWSDITVLLGGKEIKAITSIDYSEPEKEEYEFEYYYRRGNLHYFRNKFLGKIMFESHQIKELNFKYGQKLIYTIDRSAGS